MSISNEDLKRLVNEQAKRIAELEAALKPFLDNDWWEQIDWTDKTEREVWVTMADLRTARKVLENGDDNS